MLARGAPARACGCGRGLRRQRRVEDLVDQRALAGAGDAGDAGEVRRAGTQTSTSFRLCCVAPRTLEPAAAAGRRSAGHGRCVVAPGEVLAGERVLGRPAISCGVPSATTLAAVLAGAGPDVDDVVGGADGLLVVLDHDDRVAQVAQAQQGRDQAAGCRAGAGRWSARRGCRARRRGRSRSGWPAGCAGPRRRRAWRRRGRA